MKNSDNSRSFKKWQIFIAVVFVASVLTIAGIYYYYYESNLVRNEKLEELKGIASIKAEQISNWYQDELFDVESISGRSQILKSAKRLIVEEDLDSKHELSEYLKEVASVHGYYNVLFYSPDGDLIYSLREEYQEGISKLSNSILISAGSKKIIATDFYRCDNCSQIHFDLIAPVLDYDDKIIALMVTRIDPQEYIFPLVKRWPTSSKTSETLIVRKEADSVLFINELRHIPGSALNLKIPLSEKNVPAVQAVLGYSGIWEGIDYRDAEVIAQILSIEKTPWFMISKVDRDEIFSELNYRATVIVVFILLVIGMSGLGLSFIYQYKQRNVYKSLYNKEVELAEKEEEYKTTLYSIGDGVITTDTNGHVKQMNPVAEELTGWKEPDAQGKSLEQVFKIVNEDTRNNVENPVVKVLKEGLIVGLANHTLLIHKDGKEIPIADSGAPIKNEDDEIVGVVLVFRDQTEEREAEKRLKESEASLQYAQQQANLGSWEIEIGTGKGKWSDQMFRLFNLDHDKGMPEIHEYLEHIHPDDRGFMELTMKQLFEGTDPDIKEFRTNPAFGPVKYLLPTYQVIKDELGKPVKYSGTTLDITKLKLTELALKENERIFNHFMERSPIYIFFKDKNLRTIKLSRNYEKLMGKPYEELIGKSLSELFPDSEYIKSVEEDDRRTMESGKMKELGSEINGRFYSTIKFPIMIDGKAEYIAGFTIDITERKKMIEELVNAKNEAEKADRLKFEFLAQMSHEIRTPLNTVLNYTSLLKDEYKLDYSEELSQIFYGIDSASKRVIRTIDLILNISQVTTDAYEFKEKEIDLYGDVILQVERELSQTAQLKKLDLKIDKDSVDTKLVVDEYSVSQIFINLVENAIKYTKKGSINIKIFKNDQDRLQVDVADTGIGMNEEFLSTIFTPFSQEETGYTRRYEGTGLGLHLVKKYCEMNNAEITVNSVKNKGSVFSVIFNH